MSRHLSTLVGPFMGLGLLFSTAAGAQTRCASPSDQAAFDVGALKSELSVLAVSCSQEDGYNNFVIRYRSELVAKDGVVNAWFRRQYGRAAQTRYDAYITLLANAQSDAGLHQGSDFCPRLTPLFTEVMALPSASVLAEYAAGKDVVPAAAGSCEGAAATSAVTTRGGRSTTTRHTTTTRRRKK